MGRFPLPTEKQRHQIVQHRKNYEMNLSASLRMQTTAQRGTSAPPKASETASAETSNTPQVIEAEVIRSSPGVLVVQYKQESTHTKYTGILLAENGANGTPGIISEDMSRFRETVKAYVDAPIIDQWTSVIGERFTTSGLQLRARSYMRKNGRMVCASCMEAIPDNEMITRKHFVNANQRKLQSIPKETKRVVAQLPPSEKPIALLLVVEEDIEIVQEEGN